MNTVLLLSTVEYLSKTRLETSDAESISSSVLLDVSWITSREVTSTSATLRLLCWMRLIKCSSSDSKKILIRFLELSNHRDTRNSRSAYSLPLSPGGSEMLLTNTWARTWELLISARTWKTRQLKLCNIWLSVAPSRTDSLLWLMSWSAMEAKARLLSSLKPRLMLTHLSYLTRLSKTSKLCMVISLKTSVK